MTMKNVTMYEDKSHENSVVALWFESKELTKNKEYPRYIASIVAGVYMKHRGDYDVRGRFSDMDGVVDFKEVGYVGATFRNVKNNKETYMRSIARIFQKHGIKAHLIAETRGINERLIAVRKKKGLTGWYGEGRRHAEAARKGRASTRQMGSSDYHADKQRKALHAGRRVAKKSGNVYYEHRRNRSDKNRTKRI